MIWERFKIFDIWAKSIHRLMKSFPEIQIITVVAGSQKSKSRKIVEKYGFDYIEVPNSPIGRKANARLKACKKHNPDAVLLLGSDDLISNDTFAFYLDNIRHYSEIAPLDIYYYDTESKTMAHSIGYTGKREGEPIAVGRMLDKEILNLVDWQLWSDGEERFLDGWVIKKLSGLDYQKLYFRLKHHNLFILDIKSRINMTKFTMRLNYFEEDVKEMYKHLPEAKKICAVSQS